jgi:hypothetical protein
MERIDFQKPTEPIHKPINTYIRSIKTTTTTTTYNAVRLPSCAIIDEIVPLTPIPLKSLSIRNENACQPKSIEQPQTEEKRLLSLQTRRATGVGAGEQEGVVVALRPRWRKITKSTHWIANTAQSNQYIVY